MPIWIEQDPEYLKKWKTHAAFTEYGEGEEDKKGEPVIVIGHETEGEHVAHEIGHAMSGHRGAAPDIPSEVAKEEVQAWLWARRKRGRLKTNIVGTVLRDLVYFFPNLTTDDLIAIIRGAYFNLGEEPPSEDYIQGIIERIYGFE